MCGLTEPDTDGQSAPDAARTGSTPSVLRVAWPGIPGGIDARDIEEAWLQAVGRRVGGDVADHRRIRPSVKLARAFVAHFRRCRQLNLFREDDVLAERHLEEIMSNLGCDGASDDSSSPPIG